MIFVLSKLLWYAAVPSNLFIIIALAGVVLMALTGRRRGFGCVLFGILALAAVTVLPVADWAIAPLENRFPQVPVPEQVDGIVVLGGSVNPRITQARHQASIQAASERLFETAILARRFPSAHIIVSGGDSSMIPDGGMVSEAKVMHDVLIGLGVDADRIEIEGTSRNTYENALNSFRLAQPKPDETWLLITSGWHMPRSIGCFREVGWQVVPHPVDYRTTGNASTTFTAALEFARLDLAAKEWIGLVVYRLLGRTDSLFPSPHPAKS
jgi:uncharacterized SAM-binding protein YcdF (DUF218 family)